MLSLKQVMPSARCVYIGDTQNFPYGEKSHAQIQDCAVALVERALRLFNPSVIVLACNTMSVASLQVLRARFNVPFVGTVPAIKLASKVSTKRRIGLIATRHTIEDIYTDNLIATFASDCMVAKRADAELISYIEHNLFTASKQERLDAVAPAVRFFAAQNVDAIVLACTHFIHLTKEFEQVAGSGVAIIDSRDGVARQALRLANNCPAQTAAPLCAGSVGVQVDDMAVYVTSLRSASDEAEYRAWCKLSNVPFLGLLPS